MESKLKEFLKAKRLAFLAAWHPRAGNALLIKLVSKNVAKLIAREYVTLATQKGKRLEPDGVMRQPVVMTLMRPEQVIPLVIELGEYFPTKTPGVGMFHPQFYDPTLLYQESETIAVETPKLKLAFDVKHWEAQGMTNNVCLQIPEKETCVDKFVAAIRHVDQAARNQCALKDVLRVLAHTYYSDAEWFYGPLMEGKGRGGLKCKLQQRDYKTIPVFNNLNKKERKTLGEAIDAGWMRRGTQVVAIIGKPTVWTAHMRVGVKWTIRQLLVWPQPRPMDFSKFQFGTETFDYNPQLKK